jgi:predicted nucleic acid-binding protein
MDWLRVQPGRIGVDTNILVLTHRRDTPVKSQISEGLVDKHPVISTQVLSEYLNTIERRYKKSRPGLPHLEDDKIAVMRMCMSRMRGCPLQQVTYTTLRIAQAIVLRYKLQMFDSIVIAAALEAGCDTLYSEDMKHKQVIYDRLTIVNPFYID